MVIWGSNSKYWQKKNSDNENIFGLSVVLVGLKMTDFSATISVSNVRIWIYDGH